MAGIEGEEGEGVKRHTVSKCYWFLMVCAPAVIIFWPIAILVQAYRAVVDYLDHFDKPEE